MGRENGAPQGATPSFPTPGSPGLTDARAKGLAVPLTGLLLFSVLLSLTSLPRFCLRPVLVCHDDNKWMPMETAVAVLSSLPAKAHQVSRSGSEHPQTHVMGRGDRMGTYLPSSPPSSSSSPLLAEI